MNDSPYTSVVRTAHNLLEWHDNKTRELTERYQQLTDNAMERSALLRRQLELLFIATDQHLIWTRLANDVWEEGKAETWAGYWSTTPQKSPWITVSKFTRVREMTNELYHLIHNVFKYEQVVPILFAEYNFGRGEIMPKTKPGLYGFGGTLRLLQRRPRWFDNAESMPTVQIMPIVIVTMADLQALWINTLTPISAHLAEAFWEVSARLETKTMTVSLKRNIHFQSSNSDENVKVTPIPYAHQVLNVGEHNWITSASDIWTGDTLLQSLIDQWNQLPDDLLYLTKIPDGYIIS